MASHLGAIDDAERAARRGATRSTQFRESIAESIDGAADARQRASASRRRARRSSARGMLGKTSEVAAAAEQSAVAMREAAQTAAGLIRAIEDARTEVEAAAEIADARRRPGGRGGRHVARR